MQIFIDSADIEEIREAYSWGIVDGITTNPSLIKKAFTKARARDAGIAMKDVVIQVLEAAGETPVSLEVVGTSVEDMTREGRALYEMFNPIAGNVVVKVPVNPNLEAGGDARYDGLKVIKTLAGEGIPINTTLIFSPEQALLAAKAGAAFVSPFAGRIDDMLRQRIGDPFDKTDYFPEDGHLGKDGEPITDDGIASGVQLVAECVGIMAAYDLDCEVLAASLRNPRQVRECALVGADVSTIPFGVIRDMIEHDKTVEGMKAFCDDVVPEYRDMLA